MPYALSYPTSFEDGAQKLDSTSRLPRCAHNTEIVDGRDPLRPEAPQWIAVKYHRTHVVTFFKDGRVKLNTGGWRSVTTRLRIDSCSDYRLLDGSLNPERFYISQIDFEWFLRWRGAYYAFEAAELTMHPDGSVEWGDEGKRLTEVSEHYRTQNKRRKVVCS